MNILHIAVLLAGGQSTRFGGDKITAMLGGRPVFEYSFVTFQKCRDIDEIIVVGSRENHQILERAAVDFPKISFVVSGGMSRFESAKIGFLAAKNIKAHCIVFHNLANPFASERDITNVVFSALDSGAAGVGRPLFATIRSENQGIIPREKIWEMETPQAVRTDIFEAGLEKITIQPTDDIGVAEAAGIIPRLLETSAENRKITTRSDLLFLEKMMGGHTKTGIGQDSHAFSPKGILRLGGIDIQEATHLVSNSDGDAVLHAVINAISSAVGGGSISTFADKMVEKGERDSAAFLKKLLGECRKMGANLGHLSITIEASRPPLEPHFEKMKKRIGEICDIDPSAVGITATSGEGLSDFGRGKGISVFAAASIVFVKGPK